MTTIYCDSCFHCKQVTIRNENKLNKYLERFEEYPDSIFDKFYKNGKVTIKRCVFNNKRPSMSKTMNVKDCDKKELTYDGMDSK